MNFDSLTRNELLTARIECDKSQIFFTKFWFRVLRGSKFIINDHHHVIADHLKMIENYEIELLNINIPPRFSKTELAAVNMIARGIGMNPCSNWLYITASDELRAQTSVSIRDIVQHPYFKIMYGVELKRDQNGKNLWRTEKGGGLKTATIFGQITGFGAGQMIDHSAENKELEDFIRDFEGCIVLDDINKIDDTGQDNANNEKVLRVLFNTVLSRKNSSDTPIINIQQRAGLNDATAILQEFYTGNPKAKFLVMPVVSEDGKPLWEWKLSLSDIQNLKNNPKTAHIFETQYMQDPQHLEGQLFPKGCFKTYSEFPFEYVNEEGNLVTESYFNFAFADTADEGADHFSMPIFRVYPRLNRAYLYDAIFDTSPLIKQVYAVVGKCKEHGIRKMALETNGAGNFFKNRLEELMKWCEVYGRWNEKNKMGRMLSFAGLAKAYILIPENPNETVQKFLNQVYKILSTSKKEDDAPDSLCGAVSHLEMREGMFKIGEEN